MIRHLLILILLALVPGEALADGSSFAVRAGRVMTMDDGQWVIENGVIVVRDGVIVSVGDADTPIPWGLPVIDLPDATITPGFILAQSDLVSNHAGDQSVGAGFQAVDAYDRYADYRTRMRSGVTAVHVNPGWHRLVSGQGAVVRLGGDADTRVLVKHADLTVNLGPGAWAPPDVMEFTIPPSPDQTINPTRRQRPSSRLAQMLALKEAIEGAGDDMHAGALREAWNRGAALRVHAHSAVDIRSAVAFLAGAGDRTGYVVGGWQASEVAQQLRDGSIPLVYTIDAGFRRAGRSLGDDPEAIEPDVRDLAHLDGVTLALSLAPGTPIEDLRLAAALATRAGLDEERTLRALTSVPADLLGVSDHIGRIRPGLAADLVAWSGHPLDTSASVRHLFIGGEEIALEDEDDVPSALIVRAGTIWLGPDDWLENGSILVEDGRIAAVGRRVPHPPGARVVDAGDDAFIAPGFIDAHGHLGLGGDSGSVGPETSLAKLVGAPHHAERRVARAGVTTVMLAPYALGRSGTQVAAIKTDGHGRDDRVVEETAAVAFDLAGIDPRNMESTLRSRFDAARKYLEKWQKYEEELAEWERKKAAGEEIEAKPEVEEETAEEGEQDPITGTWAITVRGEILPEPADAQVALKLNGSAFEGRVTEPAVPVDHRIVGTLEGQTIKGEIEVDTGGMGFPQFEGTIEREDYCTGTITLGGMMTIDFEMTRIDREAVEFKVVTRRRRSRGEDGRPLPPKVDEGLEPLRALLEKRIPAIVSVGTARQIDAVVKLFVDKWELPLVLLNAGEAYRHASNLADKEVGVIVASEVVERRDDDVHVPARTLSRHGVSVAFQSGAEDGARSLPLMGLFAVERGMSPEAALAALTVDSARLMGVDDRVGSIATGRDGDLLIFSGHPFEAGSRLERVFVNGEEVSQ